jgi:hypothetical protein
MPPTAPNGEPPRVTVGAAETAANFLEIASCEASNPVRK